MDVNTLEGREVENKVVHELLACSNTSILSSSSGKASDTREVVGPLEMHNPCFEPAYVKDLYCGGGKNDFMKA